MHHSVQIQRGQPNGQIFLAFLKKKNLSPRLSVLVLHLNAVCEY